MSDQELTERAAKAAGLSGTWSEPFQWLVLNDKNKTIWSPLSDDGDALRLAVKLGMGCQSSLGHGCATSINMHDGYGWRCYPDLPQDCESAMRRAIVLAAAEADAGITVT